MGMIDWKGGQLDNCKSSVFIYPYLVDVVRNSSTKTLLEGKKLATFDPKLVKKIVHSRLIACSAEIGIKNADKVSKELLIPAFLDAVEKAEGDAAGSCNANIINMYNEIITTLGLDQGEEAPPEAEPEPEPTPDPEPPPPPPIAARRVERHATVAAPAPAPASSVAATPTAAPAPAPAATPAVAKAPKAPKEPKPPREKVARKGPAPKQFNRWSALGDTLSKSKGGTLTELIVLANENYVALGGKDNAKESATVVKCSISVLEKMGIVTVTNGSFTVN